MKAFKYTRNYNFYLKKRNWHFGKYYFGKYYSEGARYHEQLPSGYYSNQAWGALHKAWVGYSIAINKGEYDKEIKYAKIIQKLQKELDLPIEEFECLWH